MRLNQLSILVMAGALNIAPLAARAEPFHWDLLAFKLKGDWPALTGADGKPLTGWVFPATTDKPRAVLVCLHGIQTHGAWFAPLAAELRGKGITLVCPDRHGSGSHPANDGLTARQPSGGWKSWVADVQTVIGGERQHDAPIYLLGTSWGAKLALACLAEQEGPRPDGVLLLMPALKAQQETLPVAAGTFFSGLFNGRRGAALPLRDELYLPAGSDGRPVVSRPANAQFLAEMSTDTKLKRRATLAFQFQAKSMQRSALRELGAAAPGKDRPKMAALFASHDQIVDEKATRMELAKLGGVTMLSNLPEAGHGAQILNAAAVAKAVLGWLHAVQ